MAKNLLINILAKDQSARALKGVQKNLSDVKNRVFSLQTAIGALGAGLVLRSFVNVGKEVESLQVRFKFLFGSVEEGQLAFDNLSKFAGRVPFSLEEISRASGNLAVVADDANDLNRILEITGNVAAVTGLDFETTASQIQRAFSGGIGAADLFRERGVRALLGFEQGAKVTAEQTVKRFEELFAGDGQFAKATEDLAQTLEGTLSMIQDKYFNFQKNVAAGFFDELKAEFGDLDDFLADNEEQITQLARSIGEGLADALVLVSKSAKQVYPPMKLVAETVGGLIQGFQSLPSELQQLGVVGGILFGKKGLAVIIAFSAASKAIQDLTSSTNESLKIQNKYKDSFTDIAEEANKAKDAIDGMSTVIRTQSEDTKKLVEINNDIIELERENLRIKGEIESFDKKIRKGNQSQISERQLQIEQNNLLIDLLEEEIEKIKNRERVKTQDIETTKEKVSVLSKETKAILEQVAAEEELRRIKIENIQKDRDLLKKFDPGLAEIEAEQNKQIELNKLRNKGLISEKEYLRLREQSYKQSGERLLEVLKREGLSQRALEQITQEQRQEIIVGSAKSILEQLSQTNKTAFRAYKALQIAQATIDTYRGVTRALASAAPPLNFVLAGLTLAQGLAQVANIRSQQYQGRAMGGPIQAGSAYMVGEQGPEVIVPGTGGTVIPNSDLGKTINVNFTINAVDTRGFRALLRNERGTIVNMINQAVTDKGREAVI